MCPTSFYLVEKNPPIAWVYLNRPDKKNAMDAGAWLESPAIFNDLDQDPEIRCVILSGKGPCFSAGIDFMAMTQEIPEVLDPEQKGGVKWRLIHRIKKLQTAISCIEQCRKPVIAAIHGHCVGGGLDMISACDIRICSQDAVFSLREAAMGFVADVGSLQRLPLIIGQGHTRELAFTARDITADRAREILLVNDILKDHETLTAAAETLAREICDNAPVAVQASKEVLNFGVGKSVPDGLDYVAALSAGIIPSNDLMEAVTAFMEKRKPVFTGS